MHTITCIRKRVVDCNHFVYVFSNSSSIVLSVTNHLMQWAGTWIVMVPVCDGTMPISKQATNQCIVTSEKNRTKSCVLQKQICHAEERLLREKLDQGEREALLSKGMDQM